MRRELQKLGLLTGLLASIYCAGVAAEVTLINGREFRASSWRAQIYAPNNDLNIFCYPDSTYSYAQAQLRIPDGATLQSMRVSAKDLGAQDLQVSLTKSCQPSFDGGPVTSISVGSVSTSGTPGATNVFDAFANPSRVDNEMCIYTLTARFGDTGTSCDPALYLQRVRVQWTP